MSDPRTTPSILTRGAVDLGALRTPPPAAPVPPNQMPGGAGDPMIIDVTEATLQTEIMERSRSAPVIVEFWSAGVEQCVQLNAMLETLVRESGGAWTLARVDVDANPRVAQMFRVQGIPTVYAIIDGQLADAFSGSVPESQLRQWIGAVCQAVGLEVEVPADPRFEGADEALVNGDLEAAERAYRQILADAPADGAAEAGLAQVELLRRIEGVDAATAIAAADAAPEDVAAQSLAADIEVISGLADQAYHRLVELVRRTSGSDRDAARAHLISLFTVAGPEDPAVATARRALASALY